jgi:hypothetical protein
MDLTLNLERKFYYLVSSPINYELALDCKVRIMKWLHKSSDLPKLKVKVISQIGIPEEAVYVVGWINEKWDVLGKVEIREEDPPYAS